MRSRWPLFQRGKRAFSLVELLVTITICGLLAALLFPSLKQMMDHARSVSCVANLKRIGTLAASYAADHNGQTLPNSVQNDQVRWPRLLLETMDASVASDTASINVSNRMQFRDYANTFWCPEYVRQYGSSVHPAGRSSYGMNAYFYTHKDNLPTQVGLHTALRSEPYIVCATPKPNAVGTAEGANYFASMNDLTPTVSASAAAYLHNQSGNMLFLDGHIETLRRADAIGRYEAAVKDDAGF